jgi:hypothetical protein
VCLDANENIYTIAIAKMLMENKGLAMVVAVGTFTGKKVGPTHF